MAGCNTLAYRRTLTAESTSTERHGDCRLRSSVILWLKSYIPASTCTPPAQSNAARS